MKTLNVWLDEYSQSHQNPVNKNIHWICVPVIYFSVAGMLYALHPWVAYVALLASLIFYIPLSLPLAAGMTLLTIIMLAAIQAIPHILWVSVALFVAAWIGQFYGHKVEGKKPSFFKDLQFLLVGPIWLLNFVYQRFGIKT